jgi:hypothetical protein
MTRIAQLLLIIGGLEQWVTAFASHPSGSGVRSFTKFGNLSLEGCDGRGDELFPADVDPYQWRGCGDAYDFTWRHDFNGDITALSELDREKLVRSMGFCPQLRCQTRVNVTNGGPNGECPVGLCYSKLENGGLSFGACCFHHGAYNSGGLIGYYYKTQRQAKPIYKRSRVVLGSNASDETYDSFINANRIHPGIIATQAQLSLTIRDAKRMVIEQVCLSHSYSLMVPFSYNSSSCPYAAPVLLSFYSRSTLVLRSRSALVTLVLLSFRSRSTFVVLSFCSRTLVLLSFCSRSTYVLLSYSRSALVLLSSFCSRYSRSVLLSSCLFPSAIRSHFVPQNKWPRKPRAFIHTTEHHAVDSACANTDELYEIYWV